MKLPSPTGWSPRLLAALLRGSLPFVRPGVASGGRSDDESCIPWRGDSFEARGVRPTLGGADANRRLTYAPEPPAVAARQTQARPPGRSATRRATHPIPWEELARLRAAGEAPPRGEPAAELRELEQQPSLPVATAPHAPPMDGRSALLAPTAVAHTAVTLGWSPTALGPRPPARTVAARGRGASLGRWAFWIVGLAAALHYLGAL